MKFLSIGLMRETPVASTVRSCRRITSGAIFLTKTVMSRTNLSCLRLSVLHPSSSTLT